MNTTMDRQEEALAAAHRRIADLQLQLDQQAAAAAYAETTRRVAWGKHFSSRRASWWLLRTIQNQYRYGEWGPAEVDTFLNALADCWLDEAHDSTYRRQCYPHPGDDETFGWLRHHGLYDLGDFDQWEAVELARSTVALQHAEQADLFYGRVYDDEISDEQIEVNRRGLERVYAALQRTSDQRG